MKRRIAVLVLLVSALSLALPIRAMAHAERPSTNPPPDVGQTPDHRVIDPADVSHPLLVVCKGDVGSGASKATIDAFTDARLQALDRSLLQRCQYQDIQAAVNAVATRGTNIAVLPGTYFEQPSLRTYPAGSQCAGLLDAANAAALKNTSPVLSYAEMLACPNVLNLVAILGDPQQRYPNICQPGDSSPVNRLCDLQIEGMGQCPLDVVVDAQFKRLNIIRSDRAWGTYIRNLTTENSLFNGVYYIEDSGFAFDQVVSRWNDEYGVLSFTSDRGLYTDCETYGNGDSGIYPGAQAQRYGMRASVEVRRCKTHHNAAGFSGTAGDSLYVHDNDIYDNSIGISNDSFVPRHPGVPQNSSVYVHNRVYSNNEDFFRFARDGTCNKPFADRGYEHGVVCPSSQFPVGTGIMFAGSDFNVVAENWIYDNWLWGTLQFLVPAALRNDYDPTHAVDNDNANRYYRNYMGFDVQGQAHPNGIDFWWDEFGVENCWVDNLAAPGQQIHSSPPDFYVPNFLSPGGAPITTGVEAPGAHLTTCYENPVIGTGNAAKQLPLVPCSQYDQHSNPDPTGCGWLHTPPPPPGFNPTGQGPHNQSEVINPGSGSFLCVARAGAVQGPPQGAALPNSNPSGRSWGPVVVALLLGVVIGARLVPRRRRR